MVIWKWFPDDNWLCNQPMIMKLHTLTHHESRDAPYWFWGQKVQRSRSWRMVIWKWFPDDNWLCNQPMIMKLHTLTPHESRMCPIDFGVKRSTVKVMAHGYLKMVHRNNGCRFEFVGVGGGPVLLQQYFQYAFICCPFMLPLLFENGFRTITDSVINLWSWNFIHLLPMSQGCALLTLGSKGQRSRSWRMVIWKWSTEIMVADLNLLGSVGDLYCFSNTFSMLLYVAPICCPSCYVTFQEFTRYASLVNRGNSSYAKFKIPHTSIHFEWL